MLTPGLRTCKVERLPFGLFSLSLSLTNYFGMCFSVRTNFTAQRAQQDMTSSSPTTGFTATPGRTDPVQLNTPSKVSSSMLSHYGDAHVLKVKVHSRLGHWCQES